MNLVPWSVVARQQAERIAVLEEAIKTALEWLNAVGPGRYGAIGDLNRQQLQDALRGEL